MRTQYKPKIIFSVENKDFSDNKNAHVTFRALQLLDKQGIKHEVNTGTYKGVKEDSIILADTPRNRAFVHYLTTTYSPQECVLFMTNEGIGYLVNSDFTRLGTNYTHKERIGLLKTYKEQPQGDYTYSQSDDLYFNFVEA